MAAPLAVSGNLWQHTHSLFLLTSSADGAQARAAGDGAGHGLLAALESAGDEGPTSLFGATGGSGLAVLQVCVGHVSLSLARSLARAFCV
jgi:hypothetical protein